MELQGPGRPDRPVWVGRDTLAVQLWKPAGIAAVETLIVDAAGGSITPGPVRAAWASSPDGSLVLTNDPLRPANGPFSVQSTDAWLRGDDAILGTTAEPGEGGHQDWAFDPAGGRLAITYVTGDPDRITEYLYAESAGWA